MRTLEFKNGDQMPALGLGTWKSTPGEVGTAVKLAIELGYRHLDCAAIYGNEAEIGAALAECFESGVVERDDLWITSKLWCNAHREAAVQPAIEKTLSDLRCEYLDLYLVHWPVALNPDSKGASTGSDFLSLEEVPLAETWHAMESVAELGLTRHIGVSNYSAKKLAAHAGMSNPPEVNQVEMHPYLQQPELVRSARELGVYTTAYSPLGSLDRPDGMKAADEIPVLHDAVIASIADEMDASPAQILIAWALQRGTSVIPKSVNPKRLAENLAAASLDLSDEAMEKITALDKRRRYVKGDFWVKPGSTYTIENLWDE